MKGITRTVKPSGRFVEIVLYSNILSVDDFRRELGRIGNELFDMYLDPARYGIRFGNVIRKYIPTAPRTCELRTEKKSEFHASYRFPSGLLDATFGEELGYIFGVDLSQGA